MKTVFSVYSAKRRIWNNFLFLLFSFYVGLLPAIAQDEAQDQSLMLTSETDLHSADFYIKGTDPKEDKERTIIGQGETVTITLTGKNVDEDTPVKWVCSGNAGILDESRGPSVTLEASKTETGSVEIYAEANGKKSGTLAFTIAAPNDAKGEKMEDNAISPGRVGVDVNMFITVHPTDVSFSKLKVVEEDHGTVPDPDSAPYPFPEHEPNPEAVPISSINHFEDHIMWSMESDSAYSIVGMVKWDWISKFRTTGVNHFFKITNQTFTLVRDVKMELPPVDKVTIKIKKFDIEFLNEYNFNKK